MRTRLPDWLTFRRFAATTTGLTLTLMMLGVYTAATGSGLACSAQWPLCDNGLLPQSIPSFIEWFHRLVAMVTGFFILGTAAWAWRRDDRRVRLASTLAVVLLPLQISIGAVTVTLNGALPSGYSVPTHAAHLFTAVSIFGALTLATLWASEGSYRRPPRERARSALLASLGVVAVSALFSRVTFVLPYDPGTQAAFTGVTLALVGALLAATLWLSRAGTPGLAALAGGALALSVLVLALGRDMVIYTGTVRLLNGAAFLLAAVLVGVAAWTLSRRDAPATPPTEPATPD